MLSDTTPEAEKVQIDLLMRAGPDGRQRMLADLTDEVIDLTMQALSERHPGLADRDLRLEYIEHCYGASLALAVRRRWRAR